MTKRISPEFSRRGRKGLRGTLTSKQAGAFLARGFAVARSTRGLMRDVRAPEDFDDEIDRIGGSAPVDFSRMISSHGDDL